MLIYASVISLFFFNFSFLPDSCSSAFWRHARTDQAQDPVDFKCHEQKTYIYIKYTILEYVSRSRCLPPISTHTEVSLHFLLFFLPFYWLPFKQHIDFIMSLPALKPLHYLPVFCPPKITQLPRMFLILFLDAVMQCAKRPTATASQPLTLEHCGISIITSNGRVSFSLYRLFKTKIKGNEYHEDQEVNIPKQLLHRGIRLIENL